MADLYYFPVMPGDWLAGEATSAMTPAQEGAFFRLLCRQWMSKGVPCSLPNDDAQLAHLSRLGADWPTVGAFVRAQFEEVKGDPTRIRNPKLWGIWREKQASHKRRVSAGSVGGKATAKAKQSRSNARAMPKQLESELELEKPPSAKRGGWVARYGVPFSESSGGIAPHGEIGRHLKPLVDRDGEEPTYARWVNFCASDKRQFGAAYFAKNAGDFDVARKPALVGKADRDREHNRKMGYSQP